MFFKVFFTRLLSNLGEKPVAKRKSFLRIGLLSQCLFQYLRNKCGIATRLLLWINFPKNGSQLRVLSQSIIKIFVNKRVVDAMGEQTTHDCTPQTKR